MTLNEQHTYVLKIEQKCKELGYKWIIWSPNRYSIYIDGECALSTYLSIMSTYRVVMRGHNTTLPEFLDTHFQDMLNPTNEERTIWELETGTEWIF